ncbi:Ubiquitin carboxyl-terminal hydrolase isozyme L3 [Holothuria leucospilota]|uniref:Ubiquitin carboxyl-terminal hydrolase n=1 Tax=Holothuria leucospilota TaxID=206669 RepID=A0A9Q1GXV0_HOLLE|nr:Ubiquitin carboxyl-terminal hydrolase isozyme L3 [Holothuria leucospilota]
MHKLGMSKDWKFTDIFGLDPQSLEMIAQPVVALIVLFPISEKVLKADSERLEKIEKDGQSVSPKVYFMKQTISNACGTIGLLHAVMNVQDEVSLEPENPLKEFAEKTKAMNPDERASFLEKDKSLSVAHEESAQEGQTEAPSADDKVDHHFIALIHKDGSIYEMDGRKPFPINHGTTTDSTFLSNAAQVCKAFVERDPGELRFTIVALVPAN